MQHRCAVRVTYRMTDQMAVVYYANYFEWFEIGRTSMLRDAGLPYREMEAAGYYLPVIHAACDYKAPARYDDLLEIRTTLTELSRVRLEINYEVFRVEPTAGLLATGVTRHAIVDATGRPRRLDAAWGGKLKELMIDD